MKWNNVKDILPNNNDEVLIWSEELNNKSERKLKPIACIINCLLMFN